MCSCSRPYIHVSVKGMDKLELSLKKEKTTSNKWLILGTVSIGTFMATLDSSIVNVSLPTIREYFGVDLGIIQWVVTSYLLTISAILLSIGRWADIKGKTKIFSYGYLVFAFGSLLCGLSPTAYFLVFARIVQALGAAMLMANSMGIITNTFPPQERGRALGMVGTVVAAGSMTGPTLGGIITGAFGWQYIFYINIPIGILAFIAGQIILPKESGFGQNFDWRGSILWGSGIFFLLVGLGQVQYHGWNAPRVLFSLLLAMCLLYLFVRMEKKIEHPLVDMKLYEDPLFLFGNIAGFLSFVAMFFTTLFIPFYLQEVLNLTPSRIGLIMTAFPIAMAVVAPISGRLSDKFGPLYLTTGGMAVIALGLGAMTTLKLDTNVVGVFLRLVIIGAGMGLFQSPNNSSVMGTVPKSKLGVAGGIMATVRNVGMVTGVALSVSIFSLLNKRYLQMGLDENLAFVESLSITFMVAAGIAVLGIFTSTKRKKGILQSNS